MDNKGVSVSSEVIGDVLQELRECTDQHFELEDKVYREEHKKRHREFRKRIVGLCFDVSDYQHEAPKEIFRDLSSWWEDHIPKEDQQYSETFTAYGLK